MKRFCQGSAIAIVSLFAIGFAVAGAAAGELKTAPEIMGFSSAKTATYKTWSADYTQSMNMMGSQMTINGQMVQKPPRKVWLKIDMPMAGQQGKMQMVMGDDGMMWQIMDMAGQHQIMKMDMNRIMSNSTAATGLKINPLEQLDPSKQWEASKEMYDFQVIKGRELDGQPMYVMEGTWKQSALTNRSLAAVTSQVGKMRVIIGQSDGFVHRMEQYDKSLTNIVMAMEFTNLKFNTAVPDSLFVYQPPTNASVMDMTPMVEMQMRAREGVSAPAAPDSAPPPAPPVPKTK